MKSKNLIPVQGVYSLDGWTQWNPLLSAENRPADISSAGEGCPPKVDVAFLPAIGSLALLKVYPLVCFNLGAVYQ